jgi:hypothetical protein
MRAQVACQVACQVAWACLGERRDVAADGEGRAMSRFCTACRAARH